MKMLTRDIKQVQQKMHSKKNFEIALFSIIILCMMGAATMPIMMHGDITFGDSPSYAAIFNLEFEKAKEVHRYRVFAPLLSRFILEMIQYCGLGDTIEHLGKMQDFKDAGLRVCFWASNLIATFITAGALFILVKPLKPRILEAVGAIMIYFTSRGYLFNTGTPVVDNWEIAGLSVAAILLQRRQYTLALITGLAASFAKETSILFVGVATIVMLIADQECESRNRLWKLTAAVIVLSMGPYFIESVIKGFEQSLIGNIQLSEKETYGTAGELFSHFISNLIRSPGLTIKDFVTSLIKMNSPVLLVFGLASILISRFAGELKQLESIGRYQALLAFTFTGIVAGVFSGVFGMRFLETSFVIIPFLIYGLRKISKHFDGDNLAILAIDS